MPLLIRNKYGLFFLRLFILYITYTNSAMDAPPSGYLMITATDC